VLLEHLRSLLRGRYFLDSVGDVPLVVEKLEERIIVMPPI
jgi:hypothetical protein